MQKHCVNYRRMGAMDMFGTAQTAVVAVRTRISPVRQRTDDPPSADYNRCFSLMHESTTCDTTTATPPGTPGTP